MSEKEKKRKGGERKVWKKGVEGESKWENENETRRGERKRKKIGKNGKKKKSEMKMRKWKRVCMSEKEWRK